MPPVATLVFKTLICLKARNALIVSHHPAAAGVGARTVELIGAVLAEHGAPAALLQSVERASRTRTAMFMRHPGVSLILATGGAAMVRAAYSSGTPAIGVGTGLTPSLTLGCGTFGGNSTTDNVTYTNLLNLKRLARPFT